MDISFETGVLHYSSEGEGPALVFLHGLGGNSDNWLYQRRHFSQSRTVIAIDLPGHGRSTGRQIPFRDYWKAIAMVLDHCGVDACDICGLSMGARAGISFARCFAPRVRRLAILNAFIRLNRSDEAKRVGLYWLLERSDGGRAWR